MSTEPIAHDAGGRPIYAGAIVNICTDVAHLYDESGVSNGWVVEGLGGVGIESMYPLARKATPEALRRAAQDAVIRLRDKATGNWVFAPSLWVTLASAGAPLGTPPPNDLRELALVLFEKRNHSATDVIIALKVWGAAYVMRTNPPEIEPNTRRDLNDAWPIEIKMTDEEWEHFIDVHGDSPTRLGAFVRSAFNRSRGGAEANTLREKIADLEATLAQARKALGGVG